MGGVRSRAAALLLVTSLAAAALPNLAGTFPGTYLIDGTSNAQSLSIEVEKQHNRRLRLSVFASNEPEFRGRGKLSKDGASFTASTKATGRHAPHLKLTGTVGVGGSTLDGAFRLRRRGRADVTGTYSVAR